jgi:hypothetical protein
MGRTLNQLLIPQDVSADIERALEAQLADPLWGLSRQLLLGEFEAEAGGRPAQLETTWAASPVGRAVLGESVVALEPGRPLESVVEAEDEGGSSPAWNAEALEYRFAVEAGPDRLQAHAYDGRDLDWYHFERGDSPDSVTVAVDELVQRSIPGRLTWRGLPHPSWWRFEEGGIRFVPERDPLPNALSVLLPEFAFLDANDWYTVPVEGTAGTLQRVRSVRIIDSFGHTTELGPAIGRRPGESWRIFTLSDADPAALPDGTLLFCPDLAANPQQGDTLEEVLFVRDEVANQAWAVELAYQDPDTGTRVDRRDEEAVRLPAPAPPLPDAAMGPPRYQLRSTLAAHWIPYVPRRLSLDDPDNAQIYFRRGRTLPEASHAQPQHRTRLVAESWRLLEETLPRTGLRVQRLWRFARHSDGTPLFWVARRKDAHPHEHSAGIEQDYLV